MEFDVIRSELESLSVGEILKILGTGRKSKEMCELFNIAQPNYSNLLNNKVKKISYEFCVKIIFEYIHLRFKNCSNADEYLFCNIKMKFINSIMNANKKMEEIQNKNIQEF